MKSVSLEFKHTRSNFFYLLKDFNNNLYNQKSVGCLQQYKKINSKKQKIKHSAELLGEKAADKVNMIFDIPENYYLQKNYNLYRMRKKHKLLSSYLMLLTRSKDKKLYHRALKKTVYFSLKKGKTFSKQFKKLERTYTFKRNIAELPSLQCLAAVILLNKPTTSIRYSEQLRRHIRLKKKYKKVFPRKRDALFNKAGENRIFFKYVYRKKFKLIKKFVY